MKIILVFCFLLYSCTVIAFETIKTDKVQAGVLTNSSEWAVMTAAKEGKVLITFKFSIDNVLRLMVKDMNYANKLCGDKKRNGFFIAKFDPADNVHQLSVYFDDLCFSKKSQTLRYKVVVKTNNEKFYENSASIIVYTLKNNRRFFEK